MRERRAGLKRATLLRWVLGSLMALVFSICTAPAQDRASQRSHILWNTGWEYLEADRALRSVSTADEWVQVTLPHTWNLTDVLDQVPGYRRDASWYRKTFSLAETLADRRILLEFEGVNITTDVFVNGTRAGRHVGGYVGFQIDLTPLLRTGSNEIAVRVDNSYDPDIIPSQKSDFCIFGGITRDVWLLTVPDVYLNEVHVTTPVVSHSAASTKLAITCVNERPASETVQMEVTILDRAGTEVVQATRTATVRPGSSTVQFNLPELAQPALWSPEHPNLYTARVSLRTRDGRVDRVEERFGYRWFEFQDHGPFFLNGERLLLRGTHRHEDAAGYGPAMTDSMHRRDMRMIKEMGANFVRLAHYPQDPEVYRACDELGLLVWDELPWCRGGMGGEIWRANTTRLLAEQIAWNYNHPSIIIQSVGNEMYWLPDVPGGDQVDSLRSMVAELHRLAKRLHPGRVTALRKFSEEAHLVDVVSPSLWPGWYSGNYHGYEKALTDSREKYSRFFHAEYGGDSHVGRHTETPVSGDAMNVPEGWEESIKPQKVKNVALDSDWSESYIVDLFDWYLSLSERTPWLTGNAQWAFKDFPTPLRPENPIPYMNQKGLVDRAGNPKDAYYVFKSYWTTTPEFCRIESHTWLERVGPPGTRREVSVFSNCPEVELFLNGASQGRRTRQLGSIPAAGLSWQVPFAEGSNEVIAAGIKEGRIVANDTIVIQYHFHRNEPADHLTVSGESFADGTMLVRAAAVDKNGRLCIDYQKRVYFSVDGGGRLVEYEGTPTGSSVIEMANGRAEVRFHPDPERRSVIEVRNQDFKGVYLIVPRP